MKQQQIPIQYPTDPAELLRDVARKQTLGDAIKVCAELAGYEMDKQLQDDLGVDKGQLSRWQSNTEGIMWAKLEKLMDLCGNDAPLFWMLHRRGWDLRSIRKIESETQRQLREANERIRELETKYQNVIEGLRDVRAAA